MIPLPHPSGASTWHRTEPGKNLLDESLRLLASHPAVRNCVLRKRRLPLRLVKARKVYAVTADIGALDEISILRKKREGFLRRHFSESFPARPSFR